MTLLILSSDKDLAADFLIVELVKRGLPYFRLNSEDMAVTDYTFAVDAEGVRKEISIGGRTLALNDVRAVWYRRAISPDVTIDLPAGQRIFIAGELRHVATGLVLNPHVLWVNPIEKVFVAEHKLHQLQIARKLGFRIPRTIVSQNLHTLRDFAASNAQGTICKPIFHGLFFDGTSRYSVYTRRFDPELLDAESLIACPLLLQEEITRIGDVRATFIGSRSFIADIRGEGSLIDWRDQDTPVRYSVGVLDQETEARCYELLAELGLQYGAFDFVRTPEGSLVFLEVNPTGEWAWLEDQLGFPMRDAFVRLFYG